MKTRLLQLTLLFAFFASQIQAQNRTTINATNTDISDNLDLRAVASIFGDSKNLQDFERRLNDPKLQISNLDLNNDDQVDYLRVIETVEKYTHVIIIQSVLDYDVYQDVATIDVEKDRFNQVHLQVVGNSYLYGSNYIYEPVYYATPLIYASFWISNYRPYCSSWNWNYYPNYYYAWNPFPVFRYRYNLGICINNYNQYNYVSYRRCNNAESMYNLHRSNSYERQHPDYAFSRRNSNVNNRYELDQRRETRNVGSRNQGDYAQNRNSTSTRGNSSREYTTQRTESNRGNSQRENTQQRVEPSREYTTQRTESNRGNSQRENTQQRVEPSREYTTQRTESNRGNSQREN
uniref:hypothetical protein n=1 Tax=Flavobacterium sp. TaxID=239 RepID=UPI00286C54E0